MEVCPIHDLKQHILSSEIQEIFHCSIVVKAEMKLWKLKDANSSPVTLVVAAAPLL